MSLHSDLEVGAGPSILCCITNCALLAHSLRSVSHNWGPDKRSFLLPYSMPTFWHLCFFSSLSPVSASDRQLLCNISLPWQPSQQDNDNHVTVSTSKCGLLSNRTSYTETGFSPSKICVASVDTVEASLTNNHIPCTSAAKQHPSAVFSITQWSCKTRNNNALPVPCPLSHWLDIGEFCIFACQS